MTATPTLNLFHESLHCLSCGHEWDGYVPGFSRGHSVLTRGGRFAFIPDDLGYAFLEHIDRAHNPITRLGDFADPLRRLGWRDLESCPACNARNLAPRYDPSTTEEVACIFFDEHDFQPTANGWELTTTGNAKEQIV